MLVCGFDCVELQGYGETTDSTEVFYHWTPGQYVSDSLAQNPIACTDETVTIYLTIVSTSGCTSTDSMTIFSYDSPHADAGPTFVMTDSDSILILDGSQSTPGAQYEWIASEGGNIVSGADTSHPAVDAEGVYTLTVSIGDCSETDVTLVTADESISLFCPSDITALCHDVPFPDTPNVINHCNSAYLLQLEESIEAGDCPNNYVIFRFWTVSNGCNEEDACVQVITVIDDMAPEFIVFETQIERACETDEIIYPEVIDNCDEQVMLTYQDSILSDHPCDSYTIRTWTAEDACGNQISQEQHIYSYDFTIPEFTLVPADTQMECEAINGTPLEFAEAIDNCSSQVFIDFIDHISPNNGCEDPIEREWIATDDCGNTASVIQYIHLMDNVAPDAPQVPDDVTVECSEQIPTPFILVADDNCNQEIEGIVSENITSTGNCENAYIITRTWFFIDDCGNESSVSQNISVIDTEAPVFTFVPEDMQLECNAESDSTTVIVPAEAEDNCGGQVFIDYIDHATTNHPCDSAIEREWIATDACGNTAIAIQRIEKTDFTAPVFTFVPEDMQMNCDDGNTTDILLPEAEDNCDEQVDIFMVEHIVSDSACHLVIDREWTAIDNCGNSVSTIQRITKVDTIAPIIHDVPEDISLSCDEYQSYADSTYIYISDNCSFEPFLNYDESFENTNECTQQLTRYWSATDDCGNVTYASQIITIIDYAAPVFGPVDGVVEGTCDSIPPLPEITVTDNCDDEVNIFFTETVEGEDDCYYFLIREWTAIDNCQNTASVFQEVIIRDEEAPVFVHIPEDITIECHDLATTIPIDVSATDNCSEVIIELEETTVSGTCPNEFQITRTWTATDACGNQATAQQIVTVVDNTHPILSGVPEDMTIDCGIELPPTAIEASDNCGNEEIDILYDQQQSGDVCPFTITRTWTAVDACGNTDSQSQVITVGETTAECPNIFPMPNWTSGLNETPGEVCIPATINDSNTTILVNDVMVTYNLGCQPGESSIQLILEEGTHEVIAVDGQGCRDTIYVTAELNCPPLLEPFVIQTETFCEEDLKICLSQVSIADLEECLMILDGNEYDGHLGICDGTNDNVEIELSVGEHELVFYDIHTNCVKLTYEIFITSNNTACDMMEISLEKGWNLISSYVMPQNSDISDVFAPIADDVILVKNDLGDIHVPTFNINNIGNWNIQKGYKVKAKDDTVLRILGHKVSPTNTGIDLHPGWQIISYLRDTPSNVMNEIGAIAGDIIIIKGASGGVAIPIFGINNLGDFQPGQGYKVKAINNNTLFYSDNTPFTGNPVVEERSEELSYFTDKIANTGNNATMVFLNEAVENILNEGDEVGIFTKEGRLSGAAVYTGNHFAITIWGDDTETEHEKDGFDNNENYIVKHWNHQTQALSEWTIDYLQGDNLYQEDAVAITAAVTPSNILEEPTTTPLAQHIVMESTPNPANEQMTIHLQIPTDTDATIQLVDMNGKVIALPFTGLLHKGQHQLEVSLDNIPAGVYLYQLKTSEGVLAKKVVVTK